MCVLNMLRNRNYLKLRPKRTFLYIFKMNEEPYQTQALVSVSIHIRVYVNSNTSNSAFFVVAFLIKF